MVREVEARAHELAVVVQQQLAALSVEHEQSQQQLAALAEKNQSLLNSVQQLRRLQVRSPEQEAAASAASKLEAMVREVEARAHELAVVVQQQLAALSVEHEQSQQAQQSLLNSVQQLRRLQAELEEQVRGLKAELEALRQTHSAESEEEEQMAQLLAPPIVHWMFEIWKNVVLKCRHSSPEQNDSHSDENRFKAQQWGMRYTDIAQEQL